MIAITNSVLCNISNWHWRSLTRRRQNAWTPDSLFSSSKGQTCSGINWSGRVCVHAWVSTDGGREGGREGRRDGGREGGSARERMEETVT